VAVLIALVLIALAVGKHIKTKKKVEINEGGITFYHDPQDMRDI